MSDYCYDCQFDMINSTLNEINNSIREVNTNILSLNIVLVQAFLNKESKYEQAAKAWSDFQKMSDREREEFLLIQKNLSR